MGTTKICCVIAEWSPVGNLDIVGVGTSPSRGLRKGVVVNIDSTVESIKQAVSDAEEMAGMEVSSVIAGVAGGHIRGINSRGVVGVSGKHREVSQADIDRALEAARTVNLPQDREVIHVLPQTFIVDDQDGVKEPLGMSGVRLEVEVHLVTGATTSVRNVVRSVNRAGLSVQDIVLEPLASSEAIVSTEEKELGVLLIDLGGGTTGVALFRDGAVWYTGVLPLGGDHISNDIAVGLRTPTADAEELKKRHGLRAHGAGARGRDHRRPVRRRSEGPPALASRPLRDHPAPSRRDLHAGGARPDARGARGRGRGRRGGDGRHVHHAGRAGAVRADLRRTGAARRADGPERARRRGAESDLRDRRGAGALRGARHGGGAPPDPSEGSFAQRIGRRVRGWMGELF